MPAPIFHTMNHDSTAALPAPPAWALPDTAPEWDSLTDDGGPIASWTRDVGTVWIAAEDTVQDGRWVRSPAAVYFCEAPRDGITPAQARMLAAQLLNAADLLDEPAS